MNVFNCIRPKKPVDTNNQLITLIPHSKWISIFQTNIFSFEKRNLEAVLRPINECSPIESVFDFIFSYVPSETICGFVFFIGDDPDLSYMETYNFRVDCRNYCRDNEFPFAFTTYSCVEMQTALSIAKPRNIKEGEVVTVIGRFINVNIDIISCMSILFKNGKYYILPNYVFHENDLDSKEFMDDLFTQKLDAQHYIVVYDENNFHRYKKAFQELNPKLIARENKVKFEISHYLCRMEIESYRNPYEVIYFPATFEVKYGDKTLFKLDDNNYPAEKSAIIDVDPNKELVHEIHQKFSFDATFRGNASLENIKSSKAKVTLHVDENLIFNFNVQPIE